MTKEELKEALIAKGVKVHHLWKEERLQKEYDALMSAETAPDESKPEYTDEEIETIKDKLSEKKDTVEETLNKLEAKRNDDGLMATPSGIIVPDAVLAGIKRAHHEHYIKEMTEKVTVYKDVNGTPQFVREYELSIHGEGYANLAKDFCKKKNSEVEYL